ERAPARDAAAIAMRSQEGAAHPDAAEAGAARRGQAARPHRDARGLWPTSPTAARRRSRSRFPGPHSTFRSHTPWHLCPEWSEPLALRRAVLLAVESHSGGDCVADVLQAVGGSSGDGLEPVAPDLALDRQALCDRSALGKGAVELAIAPSGGEVHEHVV